MSPKPDFLPSAKLATLELRARLMAAVRRFFDGRGYFEVDTPLLSHDRAVDPHLEPFVVSGPTGPLYLQTSPEFAMKRLLAAGATAIYQMGHVFRAANWGSGITPNSRWSNGTARATPIANRCRSWKTSSSNYFERRHQIRQSGLVRWNSKRRFFARRTAKRFCGARDGMSCCFRRRNWLRWPERRVSIPESLDTTDRDGWLNLLLAELVEPKLGIERPEFLYDYPASQAALAVIRPEDPPVAERFELYIAGIELCNGYHELTDAADLRRRIDSESQRRRTEGQPALPASNRLLAALDAGLPRCAGVALGFDRLVMLATGAKSIADVIPFGFERA